MQMSKIERLLIGQLQIYLSKLNIWYPQASGKLRIYFGQFVS